MVCSSRSIEPYDSIVGYPEERTVIGRHPRPGHAQRLAATTLNVVVATLIGGTSGFLGGKLDLAVQRFVDAWMAFPGLLLLTIMSVAGQGLPQIIVVLGIAGGVGGSRVVRGAVVATKGNDFFLAARAVGSPTRQVLVRHVPEPGVHRQWGPPARRP